MKKIAFGALMAGLLVACGGGKTTNKTVDTRVQTFDDPPAQTCNLFAQTGCNANEKCTWIRIAASTTQQLGKVGCASTATATVDLNGSCTWGAAGDTTGFDNCKSGLICLASSEKDMATGKCEAICDHTTTSGSGAVGACPTNYACGYWANFFANPSDTGSPAAGLCDPSCDPLAQTRDTDTAAACGGGKDTSGNPVLGCYGDPAQDTTPSTFTCSDDRNPTQTADTIAYEAAYSGYFLNSCAPGFIPWFITDSQHQDSMHVMCTAYCQPVATSKESHPSPGGANPYTCQAAGHTADGECHYWWSFEGIFTGTAVPMSKWSNGLGMCEEYTRYVYDGTMIFTTGNNPYTGKAPTTTDPEPSCAVLSSTLKQFNAMVDDATYWGCQPEPTMVREGKMPHWKIPGLRLAPQYATPVSK